MEAWAWLAAYVVGFGLLQLVLYRHFSRQTPTAQSTEGHVDTTGGGQVTMTEETEAVPCQYCGTVNEGHQMVRYCRSCAEPLR